MNHEANSIFEERRSTRSRAGPLGAYLSGCVVSVVLKTGRRNDYASEVFRILNCTPMKMPARSITRPRVPNDATVGS